MSKTDVILKKTWQHTPLLSHAIYSANPKRSFQVSLCSFFSKKRKLNSFGLTTVQNNDRLSDVNDPSGPDCLIK